MADTSIASTDIHGTCAKGFERVRDAFAANFSAPGEVGASVAIVLHGEKVVDIWGGYADGNRSRPWKQETLANVWSTTKGMAALVCAMLVERGAMSYDDKVSAHWPEFAANGKADITVGQLLSHQAGLCGPAVPTTVDDYCDHGLMAARFAAQAPIWMPGSRSGYHALSVGILAGELVRRVSGKTLGGFFRDEVARPFGIDFHIGLPQSEEPRVAEMIPARTSNMPPPSSLNASQIAAMGNPAVDAGFPNKREWRAAEIPSANGQGNAAALARVYGALATDGKIDGKVLVKPETIGAMTALQIEGHDEVLAMPARWGAGYLLNVGGLYGPNERTFGHSGWGGSFGIADPDTGLAIAYVMNLMGPDLAGDARANALVAAAYASL